VTNKPQSSLKNGDITIITASTVPEQGQGRRKTKLFKLEPKTLQLQVENQDG